MAKFSLQEMYLTEYNRLIAALQTYFSAGASFTTIEQWADYLNSVKSSKEIKKVDLNNIVFASDVTGTTTDYVQGSQSIELTKHNNLIASNIKKGVTVEGITGTLVDGSTIVKLSDIQDVLDNRILSSLETGYSYWYYDDTAKQLKSGAGKAQATQINKELTLGTDLLYSSGIFNLSETYANIPLKNFTVKPNAVITEIETNVDGNYVIPVGYVPTILELPRLSDAEKTFLQNNLEYNKEILGVKGSNSAIVNTVNSTPGDNNHIIGGQKYWRNGIEYNGSLLELTLSDVIQNDLIEPITNTITAPEISGNSAIIIPANTYTHSNINFDITNLKAENIKNGIDIMGIVGNADIVDLYEGPTTFSIGTTSPILIEDEDGNFTIETDSIGLKDKRLDDSLLFLPVADTYANDIVVGKSIGGLTGTFSERSNDFISYVAEEYDEEGNVKEVETIIEANGSVIKHSESNDIALDKYAFIAGRLVRGTNTSLVDQEEYTDDYLIELNDTTPPELLETKDKLLTDNIAIWINADKINSNNIAYGNTILGIPGEFTHQETNPITTSDVLSGKVGYVNGVEITGNIPNHGDKIYSSSLKQQPGASGCYKTLTINPITFTKNSVVHTYEESGGNTLIPSLIRKGWVVDGVTGTGSMLHIANSPAEITALVSSEEDDDVILYKGTTNGPYINNSYYEIVKKEEEFKLAGYTMPTADKLIRARDLSEATTDTKHILSGVVVYGNRGEKLTGSMSNQGKATYIIAPNINYTTTTLTGGEGYYSGVEVKVNTEAINANIIRSGNSLFGVQGTYSPSLDTLNIDAPGNDWTTDAQGYLTKTYTPTSGTDGWNRINIKSLIRKYTHNTNITTNGQHTFNVTTNDVGAHGWNEVTFNVNVAAPELETLVVTEENIPADSIFKAWGEGVNGWDTVDLTQYHTEVELDTLNVTSNGTYNAADKGVTGWDTVTVNVHTVSGMPAVPIIKDYDLYMEGDNTTWLHNSYIVFDDNDDLGVYYTSISGNSNFPLINICDNIDMSNVKVESVSLGTINLNPIFTNDAITQTPEKHTVAYFPAGKYCFPVWSTLSSIAAMAQEAKWNCNIFINGTLYTKLTTLQLQNRLVRAEDSAGNRITIFNLQETPQWKYSNFTITKPIMIPIDYYTSVCMRDLSLLFKPVKQEARTTPATITSGKLPLIQDDVGWYSSKGTIVYNKPINISKGDYVVYSGAAQQSNWALYNGGSGATMKITIDDEHHFVATVSPSGITVVGYSRKAEDKIFIPIGTYSVVTP